MTRLLERLRRGALVLETQDEVVHWNHLDIDHLAIDSRGVRPGGLFVAIRGERTDGHLFFDKAVQNGAVAIVCEATPEDAAVRFPGVAFVHVRDSRAAAAELAAAFYEDPSQALKMVGVTGTNGKTTTVFLVHHLLETLGEKSGLLGTVGYRVGPEQMASTHTTPDALAVQGMLRQMVDAGCTACAMEVSSHALAQERVRGVAYDVALFTNLTQDHLDYHATFEAYLQAKKKLFDALPATATALTNVDDPSGVLIVRDTAARIWSYGQSPEADLRFDVVANTLNGLRLRIDGHERVFPLVGRFNAYNLAAAYGAGRALGYESKAVLDALAQAPPTPGRFERFRFPEDVTVIVDYAHTPDALENVLRTMRETMTRTRVLWCVFGCGGERDRAKRGRMGAIAEQYADRVVVTADNPRTEPIAQIMADIRSGMAHPEEARWIEDRRAAIHDVAAHVGAGDVVLVAGKGHETVQVVGTEHLPHDDRVEVQEAFGRQASAGA